MPRSLAISLILLALVATARAGEGCPTCPSEDAAARPAGHTEVAQALPEGHPEVAPTMPKGHPPVDRTAGALPKGHPTIGQPGATSQPTSQPASGTLAIRVVQGTNGGKPVDGGEVTVSLYRLTGPFKTIAAKLDEGGHAVLEGLPIDPVMQPQILIEYQGVEYEALGEVMSAANPRQQVEVPVYETTRSKPPWRVAMRHVILTATAYGYRVKDGMSIQNPTDRSWIGPAEKDADPTTLTTSVPAGARDFKPIRGFDACCSKMVDGKVTNKGPIRAGKTNYQMRYDLAARDGQVVIDLTARSATDALMIFVPDDGTTIDTSHFEDMGTFDIHKQKLRTYKVTDLEPGARTVLTIQRPRQDVPAAPTAGAPAEASTQGPKVVAGAGMLGVFVAGVALMLFKGSRKRSA